MREVMDALEWVRPKVFVRGSPDFVRARQLEARVKEISRELTRDKAIQQSRYARKSLRNGR